MECPACRHSNPPTARFCNACGAGLELVCPRCAHANAAGSRFCNQCGQALVADGSGPPAGRFAAPQGYTPPHLAEKILTSRAALQGERKLVTVLFADLKGSMELLADRDPEEARRLLDPVLERMIEAVHRYEGTVNQVMGDGIMALFGAPVAHEDHASRACYSALALQAALRRHSEELRRTQGLAVAARVGLNSGEVVVRAIGGDLRMDYSAVGQTTHLAARMEQLATPGTILATAATIRLAEGYMETRPLGPVPVKGLAEPVEAYELLGATGARTRLQAAAARGLARFVGRQAELTQLERAHAQAVDGQGQVVALVGEPGVGKSRLVWEFLRGPERAGALTLESSSMSYGKATPYLPVVDLLRAYLKIGDGDDHRTVREKVTGKVLTLDPALQDVVAPCLSLLEARAADADLGAADPPQREARIADAIKRLLLRESRVQPLVLVFEDLHWIDAQTQAFLDSLVESLPTAPVLLLVNYRPEYRHGWASRRNYTQIRVDPLGGESARELLGDLLGSDPALEPLARLLIERTEGNPFFLEECIRTLVETRALVGERGAYRPAGPLQAIQVPPTVQALVAARIDRLPAEDKHVIQAASVVGKDVGLAVLAAISDLAEPGLEGALARLQSAEFLYETSLFPEREYTFVHALTVEVAYQSLLQERRRALHARMVDALERLYPGRTGEHADRLAHHAFRGEVWNKALRYMREIEVGSAEASLKAIQLDPGQAGYLWWTGDHARALTTAERELAIGLNFANFSLQILATLRLAQASHSLGRYGDAAALLVRNIEALQGDLRLDRLGLMAVPAVTCRGWLAWCLAEQGELATARQIADEAVALADATGHEHTQIVAHYTAGLADLLRGDHGRAIALLERGLVLDRHANVPQLFPFVAAPLGHAYVAVGRHEEGLTLLEQAGARAAALKLVAGQSLTTVWLGRAHLAAGQTERAGQVAARALMLAREHGERGHEAWALHLLGDLASARPGGDEAAAESYREALDLATALGMRPLAARCYLALGQLHARGGRTSEAEAALGRARADFAALGLAGPPAASGTITT